MCARLKKSAEKRMIDIMDAVSYLYKESDTFEICANMKPEEIDSIIFQKSAQIRELILIKHEVEKRKRRLTIVK
jgi:hypothetical protein